MISKDMIELGSKRSTIRELFEFGKKRKEEIGAENVFDFSLGNPNAQPPDCVRKTIEETIKDDRMIHGYTSANGDVGTREQIAQYIRATNDFVVDPDDVFMTCGAAASLTITFKALTVPGDEYIVLAPFFPEYKVFVEGAGGKLVVCDTDKDFQIDFTKLENAITKTTKAIVINSPNNPTGAVYDENSIKKLGELLDKKSSEFGHIIYLITDEPYREVVYDDTSIPYVPKYYKNTIVCYSFSKAMSLAGERIGYIMTPKSLENREEIGYAIAGAARVLGYVNAPSLFQRVIRDNIGEFSDMEIYRGNREILIDTLEKAGFQCTKPEGAFYLFPKALEEDSIRFSEKAKEFNILLVPGDDFYRPGYFRLSYCVRRKTVEDSVKAFMELGKWYRDNHGK